MKVFVNELQATVRKIALPIYNKYPAFWKETDDLPDNWYILQEMIALQDGVTDIERDEICADLVALIDYWKSETRSKDPVRVFNKASSLIVTQLGYNPEVVTTQMYLYYILVLYPTMNMTLDWDIRGSFLCYVNTGEIDDEHDWSCTEY